MGDNITNEVWKATVSSCYDNPSFVVEPRGMEVRERWGSAYTVPMPAFIDLKERKVNVAFMMAEAAWILRGSNRLKDLTDYMKAYENFSDDGVFLRGAYGPKVVEQLPYVVDTLINDNDSRQAVMSIWRERPGPSKDVPCTVSMQFMVRNGKLNMISTMRSNDVVLGFTYDVFSFSMVANAVRLLLEKRGLSVELGDLMVQAGSLHIYERHYEEVSGWLEAEKRDKSIGKRVLEVMKAQSYEELIEFLEEQAKEAKK